ncbi:site-specific integrase [Aquabacterium soli]|uniref:Site-specific integrase n=1 Tax=Aquabacterium soli TaxID=2493092 RepID=A0A3R8YPI9_9BURK|nr:site-specific integrase [Aquabacterium soli]RRS05051.1 site-specific integrase [Aquabacterium soli]
MNDNATSRQPRAKKWTDEKVKALKLPEGKREHRVLVDSGLYVFLRAKAGGDVSKQWQYRAQVNGARRWLSLGAYPAVGLAKAKSDLLIHQAAHETAKKGEGDHPVIVAQVARRKAKSEPTVEEVFKEWLEDKRLGSARKGGRPVRERTITVLKQNYDIYIGPKAAQHKFAKLDRTVIQETIDIPRRKGSPGAAAQVYRTWRGLVNFAMKREYVAGADPMRGIENPKPYRPAPVNAATDAELLALFKAIDASRLNEATKLAIEFQLLTGARPTEVRLATFSEFNMRRGIWAIPPERVKSDRPFNIHLSAEAQAIFRRAKALPRVEGNQSVFPGIGKGPMEKMAVARALSRLAQRIEDQGGKRLRPHDLRRTFRTMLSRLGVQPHIAELCMNHQETETMRRVYDGHDYFGEMTQAWDKAGAHLAAIRAGGALVIPIAKKTAA